MAEAATLLDAGKVDDRANAYAAWVAQLRDSRTVPILAADGTDSLARLGQELQLLADILSQRERELRQLFDLVGMVEQGMLVDDVLNQIFDRFKGLIPYDRMSCAFLSRNGDTVTAYWARSNLGPLKISAGYSQPLAGSSLEPILLSGQPRILNDLEEYLKTKPQSDATRRIVEEGGRSSLTCPLSADHRAIGFLFFTSQSKDRYEETHQTIFRQIASQVSAVIANSRVYLQIILRNRQLIEEGRNLTEIATRDALTGVLNRGAIMQAVERALIEAAMSLKPVGIIMVDIDHFKNINDSLGHLAGDTALQDFARRLSGAIRQSDQLGRYGGEEFLIIAAGPLTFETLSKAAERLRQAASDRPFDLGGEMRIITASFGAVIASGINESVADVIAAADRALYAAKNSGRNRVVIAGEAVLSPD